MRRWRLSILLPGLLAVLAVVVTGCGGSTKTVGKKAAPIKGAKRGGTVTYLAAGDVDYVDPGQDYYTFGYMVQYAVNRPLYSFKPPDFNNPVPDLAAAMPVISADKKMITIKLKRGVKYAPPVNREVTSADVKYAFERSFTSNVPSGYATSYFADIVGAPATPGPYKPIPGIETPDPSTLVIKLSRPSAVTVTGALVMPISIPVPKEYAQKFDQKAPSTYDQYVAFTGPYMIQNDAQGKLTGRNPGKSIQIVRNPNWDPKTDYRPAYLDAINIQEGNSDLTVSGRRALQGTRTLCCDSGQPPTTILQAAVTQFKDQLGQVPSGGTRWIALNTTIKPFDNINVRRALFAVFDRNALRLTRGGATVGPIAQHFIPPGIQGFNESGGTKGFTDLDFTQSPAGNPALATKYMNLAAAQGVPVKNGKYAGGGNLLTIASNAKPALDTAQVAQAQFAKLGFNLIFREVPQDTLYTKFCGVPKAHVAICPNVGWFKDFLDPQSMLQPTFSGAAIKPQGNVNWSQLNDPNVNSLINRYETTSAGPVRNKQWAQVNHAITADAPGIPYVWDNSYQLASKDVNGVMNGYYTTWDLNFTSVK